MKQYLLLLKGKKELDYSPEQLQKRLEEYRTWVTTIEEHYVADNRLERIGAHISQKNEITTDGPFLEAKEIIAGFIIIKATNLDEAVTISNSSPLLNYFEIYVRPMVPND
ncbi:YciI family protein [Neotamlana sedimentorum]|uniref:YciI family protein n=1 Tax=Neotamlana sedimentorum TaxID=1435349 RepID=UPI0005CC17C8|nr:YciI family protein [Tamlana sedimentorum]